MVRFKLSLADLAEGQACTIRGIDVSTPIAERLLELGFVPGTAVQALGHAPLGDPTTFLIRGYRIGLRRSEAALIDVEPTLRDE